MRHKDRIKASSVQSVVTRIVSEWIAFIGHISLIKQIKSTVELKSQTNHCSLQPSVRTLPSVGNSASFSPVIIFFLLSFYCTWVFAIFLTVLWCLSLPVSARGIHMTNKYPCILFSRLFRTVNPAGVSTSVSLHTVSTDNNANINTVHAHVRVQTVPRPHTCHMVAQPRCSCWQHVQSQC